MRVFLFALLLATTAAAQPAPRPVGGAPAGTSADPGTEAAKKARLEGSVVSLTGEPIPRATLRLQGTAIQAGQLNTAVSVTADDAGKFVFPAVEPGRNYQLTAQRPGYVAARYGARAPNAPGAPLSLEEGQVVKGVVVTMTPQGVISGRVSEQNGDPIQGAMVLVLRPGYQRGVRVMSPMNTLQTNEQGEYRFANLPPGRYFLAVTGRPIIEVLTPTGDAAARAEGNITTYYPNGGDIQSAAPLNITAGSELRGIDIRMRKGRMFHIRGKVVNGATGAPAGGVVLRAQPKQDLMAGGTILTQLSGATTQARAQDGVFELRNLVPGTYLIQTMNGVSINGATTPKLTGSLEVTLSDQDVSGVVFALGPGATITGSVRLEQGDIKTILPASQEPGNAQLAVAAATAGVALPGARPAVALNEVVPSGGNPQAGLINPDGTFKLEGIGPSKFGLNVVQLPAGHYIKSARFGGTDVTHAPIDLTLGGGGTLDILLSNKAAEVNGAVRSEKGDSMSGIMVALWTKEIEPGSTSNGVRTAYTDQNGGFRFASLPPGEYYLAAWESGETGQVQNRDLLAMFTGDANELKLGEAARQAVEVKLITAEKLAAAAEKIP
jgi:hypothetical protein